MPIDLEESFILSIDKISFTCNEINRDQVEKTCHRLFEAANAPFSGIQIKSELAVSIAMCNTDPEFY